MIQPFELSPTLAAVLELPVPTAPAVPAASPAGGHAPAATPAPAATAGAHVTPATAATDGAAPSPSASHDSPPPKALLDFMVQGWTPPTGALPAPVAHHEVFARRRRALEERFPGDTLVVASGHLKVRSNDTHYAFRPASDFYYLTGNVEPDCVLVLEPKPGGGHEDVLFVEPNPGRSDPTFFTDRLKGELWVGARLGVPESRARFAIDACRPLAELPACLEALRDRGARPSRVVRGTSRRIDDVVPALSHDGERDRDRDQELTTALGEMRLLKDEVELAELRAAVAATARGFEDVIRRLPDARTEREIEGIFNLRARVEGNDVGYGTIAASGHHACTMHYTRNDGVLDPASLLLLDAGVEGNSLYTADITRTLPISGRFTREQRILYKLVYKAQKAALAEVKPGNDFMAPNKAAMRVLAEGLEALGALPTTAEDALQEEHQFYKRFSLHNVSHMLGLDVHDCAEARKEAYKFGKLKPGMVLTVEPGLYFQKDDLTAPEAYRGIGVRIEDDVVVTETGVEILSAAIPSQVDEVEAWMARLWKKEKRRRR